MYFIILYITNYWELENDLDSKSIFGENDNPIHQNSFDYLKTVLKP